MYIILGILWLTAAALISFLMRECQKDEGARKKRRYTGEAVCR